MGGSNLTPRYSLEFTITKNFLCFVFFLWFKPLDLNTAWLGFSRALWRLAKEASSLVNGWKAGQRGGARSEKLCRSRCLCPLSRLWGPPAHGCVHLTSTCTHSECHTSKTMDKIFQVLIPESVATTTRRRCSGSQQIYACRTRVPGPSAN